MSNSARKNRNQRIDKRLGHKQARQATRRVLNGDARSTPVVHGTHWSSSVEQPPVVDAPVGPPKTRRQPCKKSKDGRHYAIQKPARQVGWRTTTDLYGNEISIPNYGWRIPIIVCENCRKHLWRWRGEVHPSVEHRMRSERTTIRENEVKGDHYDLWNIRARLLGLKCRCLTCNPEWFVLS